jgi:three-Cys-motif partner protein
MIVTAFSDADPENVQSLKNAINTLPNINTLKNKPQVYTEIVNDKVAEIFNSIKLIPSLTFLDPWGYKGLSTQLINSVIKDWGCDCIVFFNYNRINMGLSNDLVKEHMDALFGKERAATLRTELTSSLTPPEREKKILKALSDSLKDLGGDFVLPFRFRGEQGERISHHLVFVTKHIKGYNIMKDIMANASSNHYQGVPSFEYSPIEEIRPHLFLPDSPIDNLKRDISRIFVGKSISVIELYNKHNVGTNYIKKNYKQALMQLEQEGKVLMNPTSDRRKKNTLADNVKVTFPSKEIR